MSVLRDLANQTEYGGQMELAKSAEIVRNATLAENLESRKKSLEIQLAKVNKAIEVVKANPNIESFIDILSQV
jgi:hypothetical protein